MNVLKVAPRGYCYGVVDAMVIAKKTAENPEYPRPIYILGMIVHNKHVTEAFEEDGIITLDGPNRKEILEQVNEGTVIFTAHGVSPEVRRLARDKGLTTVDATCPDVTRTHDLIRERKADGYEVIYIGKRGHPEPEGAVGVAPDIVHLVENVDDAKNLAINSEKIVITNQTTMSQWDVSDVMKACKEKYPHAEIHNEICLATQTRQEAVAEQAGAADLLIVVGDPKSNNSNRLAQVSYDVAGTPAYRISHVNDLNTEWLRGLETIAVTAGASTPTPITKEVIRFIEQFDPDDPHTWDTTSTVKLSKILPKIRTSDIPERAKQEF
ncbi:4-hydroxy-3-methylbut-2-enyl diphosphate reductase [Salisediminibacterium halotolerans]|uniref:4-hydroxy-3-methylbut-2-enyl diphosphate reductase n=1 Tax=Salisediminibacterium halotolerans TaxID=517425 RepID=A0A1H9S7X9_9BACI|nr:4-hydroxy-3-methylbut-2-enyl diphosphate reductase [Salisediminibacterium haloalkalitolerans]SER81097.1 4-hydroxy-3-methylbut-2-enyl diphosphate reductase [Salisediminibacterium haloalkalitolerans]